MSKDDLGYKAYKKRVAPKLVNEHKIKKKSFGIWVRKNIRKAEGGNSETSAVKSGEVWEVS
jgi:hypothetical protein